MIAFLQRVTHAAVETEGRTIGRIDRGLMMVPYSITFLIAWTLFLLAFYWLGIPLGVLSSYEYVPAAP